MLCTLTIAAFTTPSWGLSWNMPRKMTPAASIEIAIGMNTMRRNAVFQPSLSTSTAKMRPMTVTVTGATITHIRLLRIAVKVVSFVNMVT